MFSQILSDLSCGGDPGSSYICGPLPVLSDGVPDKDRLLIRILRNVSDSDVLQKCGVHVNFGVYGSHCSAYCKDSRFRLFCAGCFVYDAFVSFSSVFLEIIILFDP